MSDELDRRSLVARLRLDRSPEQVTEFPSGSRLWLFGALALALGALVLFIAVLRLRSTEMASQETVARPVQALPRTPAVPVAASGPEFVLEASGFVVARRKATVSAEATGQLVEVRIEEGQQVEQGDLIARLDDRVARAELSHAEEEVQSLRLRAVELGLRSEQAYVDHGRVRELAVRSIASTTTLDRAELQAKSLAAQVARAEQDVRVASRQVEIRRARLERTRVLAPFSGIVTEKSAHLGEMISPVSAGGGFTRTGICTIVDMDSLEGEVDVAEQFLGRLTVGQKAIIALDALPDATFDAKVVSIGPGVDRSRATIRVRLAFQEEDPRILPDMAIRVGFLARPAQDESSPRRPDPPANPGTPRSPR